MKHRYSIQISLIALSLNVVFSADILVVDDDNNYNNESRLYAALDNNVIVYDTYDCDAEGGSPTTAVMAAYELVIWFTGSDGGSNYFWNGDETDNTEIAGYLDGGGKMWLYGIDVLYDRYSGAPDTFAPGDFIYDYFGIASYDVQSHTGDDASGGVPQLDQTDNVISTIDPITWNYSSLYYVDGVTPVEGAVSHYIMGPESYVYAGYSTVQSYTTDTFSVMSAFFKNWNFGSDDDRDVWVNDVVSWFFSGDEAPTDFSLVAPENGLLIVIDDESTTYDFSWNASTDPEGNTIDYTMNLVDNVDNEVLLTYNTSNVGVSVSAADIMPFVLDTLECSWFVLATDGVSTTSSDTFAVSFAVEVNQAPMAFSLVSPVDGVGFLMSEMDEAGITFTWEEAVDPNEDVVTYTFSLNEAVTEADISGASFAISKADLAGIIGDANAVSLDWFVQATDGEYTTNSDTNSVVLSNQDMSVLVVDDDAYQNYEHSLYQALEANGFVYDAFDCEVEFGSPTFELMSGYDLVIWYAGNDGGDLYFWNGIEEDNQAIKDYLDNGGKLWINGLDILYDRYGSAPDAFSVGDFPYDYLGISSYDVQSRSDDEGLGAPQIDLVDVDPISAIDPIVWRFSTAWYIDGVSITNRSFANYVMGPEDYILAGAINVSHYIGDNFTVLNSWFNLNHIDDDTLRIPFVGDVMDWLSTVNTGDAPTAFNLLAPEAGAEMEIFLTNAEDVEFSWEASTDTEGITYRFILDSEFDGSIIQEDQSETSFIVNEQLLYGLLPDGVDTVNISWKVLAFDPQHNITEAPYQTLTIIRELGSGPAPFGLLSPLYGATIRAHEDEVTLTDFVWEASVDPDGDAVSYTFTIITDSTVIYEAVLSDTVISLTSSELLGLLGDEEAIDISWNVVASDGTFETAAYDAFYGRIVNILPQGMSILVVDDDNRYNNETKLYTALYNTFYDYDSFDCSAADASPSLEILIQYDLVIWFAGSDGVDLYFWSGNDTENPVIGEYLDTGGRMWVYGMDILYDMYGGAIDYFAPGDVMYDYFGTLSYRAQSWANDDSQGLPMLVSTDYTAVTTMDTITWNTSSGILKYADGCDIAGGAMADMLFGPEDYQLAGMVNSYHYTDGNFLTMSSWTNPYYLVSDSARALWVGDVMNWFNNTMVLGTLPEVELVSPAVGTEITLNDLSEQFTFEWNAVESDDVVIYQLVIESSGEGVYPYVVSTTETSITLSGDVLYSLSGSGADIMNLSWSVVAQTPMAAMSSSATQEHVFIEGINESPSDFALIYPANEDTLTMDDNEGFIDFIWSPAVDPEGDVITYTFFLIGQTDTLYTASVQDTIISISQGMIREGMVDTEEMTFWRVFASDGEFEVSTTPNLLYIINNILGLEELMIPDEFALKQNYPNPFNPITNIQFALPMDTHVNLSVYNLLGQHVIELVNGHYHAGFHQIRWNGKNRLGQDVGSGVYIYVVQADKYHATRKMVFLK